jgi:O-acetyl-ADP-ribose deacetylase (regulator of RNase III)
MRGREFRARASVAMPEFATGHARLDFDLAVVAMGEAIRDPSTSVERVLIVVS